MEEKKNPWLSIWTSPRETIRQINEQNPNRALFALCWIYGFSALLNLSQSMMLGASLSTIAILIIALILAPLYGYINFSIWSFFVHIVGKLFKGAATFKSVRSAYAWSSVPILINVPLWLLMVALFGHQLFLNMPNAETLSGGKVFILFAVLILKVIISVWSFVIYVIGLSEVQKYSVLRSIFNILVTAVLVAVLVYILWMILAFATTGMAVSPTTFINL